MTSPCRWATTSATWAFHERQVAAAREDGLPEPPPPPIPPLDSLTDVEWFWRWVEDDTPPTEASSSLLRTVRHIESFWEEQDGGIDVVLLHYADLTSDLDGQMRALAARLEIDVSEDLWPCLVDAASLTSMRRDSARTAPSGGIWKDEAGFFKRGRSGAWHEVLATDDDQKRYDERVSSLTAPDLVSWLHRS